MKINKSYLLNFLFISQLFLLVFCLMCSKTTGPETREPLEIKWQQTALNSASNGVYADKYSEVIKYFLRRLQESPHQLEMILSFLQEAEQKAA